MKNYYLIFIIYCFSLSACSSHQPKKIRIGLSMATYTEERWKKDADLFEARANELGADVISQVCNGDEQLQNQQIENLLTQQIDVLVIVPQNSKTCASAVNAAKQAGVPVIAYDRIIKDCDLDLYVSFDNIKVGEMQAQYMLNVAPKGNYVLLEGSSTDENAFMFESGQMNILKPAVDSGKIKIIVQQYCKDWLPIEAMKITQNALTLSNNNIQAIVSSYDGLSSGAIQALTEQQLQGKVAVSGQDAELTAIQRIIDGTQTMTIYKPLKQLAKLGAESAVMLAKKQTLNNVNAKTNNGLKDVASILLQPIAVDKENIVSTVIKDGYIDSSKLKMAK